MKINGLIWLRNVVDNMAGSKAKTLPTTQSIDELVDFFDEHDMGEYWEQMPEAEFEVNIKEMRFAICVNNEGYADDLKVRTVYQILPDESAARSDYLRVVDETGEDYLYPASYFVLIDVPAEAAEALLLAA